MLLVMAVGAGSASASGFNSEWYPANVSGETVNFAPEFHIGWGGFGCKDGLSFEGAVLEMGGPTLSPSSMTDGKCSVGGAVFTMHMNGCRTIFHADGTMDIGPPGCGPISFTTAVYPCEVTIGSQTGLTGVSYENVEKHILINARVTGFKYTQKGSKCTAGTYTDGQLAANWKTAATYGGGINTGLSFGPIPTGVFISSEHKLDAEAFPVSLSGSQTGSPLIFGSTYGSVKCPYAKFSGELSAASAEVSLQADYSAGCTSNGISGSTTVMNGCAYVAHIAGSGPPYTGTMDIACPAGKAIEIRAIVAGVTKCTTTIAAQSGLSGFTFTNTGSGSGRAVEVGFNLSAIHYHQQEGTGLGRCTTGDFENGTYTGKVILSGAR